MYNDLINEIYNDRDKGGSYGSYFFGEDVKAGPGVYPGRYQVRDR